MEYTLHTTSKKKTFQATDYEKMLDDLPSQIRDGENFSHEGEEYLYRSAAMSKLPEGQSPKQGYKINKKFVHAAPFSSSQSLKLSVDFGKRWGKDNRRGEV